MTVVIKLFDSKGDQARKASKYIAKVYYGLDLICAIRFNVMRKSGNTFESGLQEPFENMTFFDEIIDARENILYIPE